MARVAQQSLPETRLIPLLTTRLSPPRLPVGLVERPRLLARLDTCFAYKITLVVAPAGSGKSTLVNQWLAVQHTSQFSPATSWVSLDAADNDVLRFWYIVMTACQKLLEPERQVEGQAAVELLTSPFSPLDAPPLELALTRLLNVLADSSSKGLLVLDEYQVISEPLLHETLAFFLDHVPVNVHVLLLSRTEPRQLPLLRWQARGELLELHADDLRFSSEETAAFVQQAFSFPLSDAALKHLEVTLQGWVAGLRLLTLILARQTTSHAVEQALTSFGQHDDLSSFYQPLLDYFIVEVLNTQSEHVQDFLLKTSILNRLHGSLCAAITGKGNSVAQLDAIAHAGLFLEALDGVEGWYRVHPLFSEALSREAKHRLGEETLHMLSLQASFWYEQHAMMTEAVEAALQAHSFERAALLMEQMDMHGQRSELHTVHHWLELMPEIVLRQHPMLCWLAALSLHVLHEEDATCTFENVRVETWLQMAEEGWHCQNNQDLIGLVPALRAIHAWKSKQFARAMEYAQQALTQLSVTGQDSHTQQFRTICLFIVGTGFMYEGQFEEARSCFQKAYEGNQGNLTMDGRHFTAGMFLLVGGCYDALCELHQAHECYQKALSLGRKHEDREIIAQALQNLARLAFEWNDLTTAEQQLHEAQTLALETEQDLHNSLDLQLALLADAHGQVTVAQQQVSGLLACLQMTATPEASIRLPDVLLVSARLALEVHDVQTVKLLLKNPVLQNHPGVSIVQARLNLLQSKPSEALFELEALLPIIHSRRQVIEIQVLLALAHMACQEEDEARHWLQQALSLARVEGFLRLFLSEGQPLVRLLRQCIPTIQEKELRSYAQRILRAFALTTQEHTAHRDATEYSIVEALSTQEQRVLRLLAAGETNRQIAQELVVSVNTVKDHLKHLYNKLGVNNRLQASEVAHRLNLL